MVQEQEQEVDIKEEVVVEQQGEQEVIEDFNATAPQTVIVHEEMLENSVEDSKNQDDVLGIGSDFFVAEEVVGNAEEVVQVQGEDQEEVVTEIVDAGNGIPQQQQQQRRTPSSETEMSVAMEMARLSQQRYNNNFDDEDDDEDSYSDSENATPPPFNDSDGENRTTEKPRMSYAQLIAEALLNRSDRMLTLSEIYAAINRRYPYYRMDVKSWQNAIRHNLTLNTAFTKVPRPSSEGRGNYWRIETGAERVIFKRQIRNHHYNRKSAGLPGPSQRALMHQQLQQEQRHQTYQRQREVDQAVNEIVKQATSEGVEPERVVVDTDAKPVQPQQQRTVHIIKTPAGVKQPQILRLKQQIVQPNGSVVFIALPATPVTTTTTPVGATVTKVT